jgi:hypothetical protein
VDFDGDGIGDILTGCWLGELYVFKGQGQGKFAAGVKLQRDGKDIKLGTASTVFAADWRGKGRLDLLVGNIQGEIYLIPNNGSTARPVYGTPQKLQAGGQAISAPHGDSQPVVADWDGDGLLDLIVGCGDGSVVWFRNIGSKTEPKLAKGVALVNAAAQPNSSEDAPPDKTVRPGMRAKVSVADFNGDGHLDLLVGDFGMSFGQKPKMSEEDEKVEKEARAKMQQLQAKMQPYREEYSKMLEPKPDEQNSPEAQAQREKKAADVFKKQAYQKLQLGLENTYATIRRFERPYQYHGYVWLYLRQPRTAAAQAK